MTTQPCHASKPSALRHFLCASMSFLHSACSSPLLTTHASRAAFVSGQAQQIFFFLGASLPAAAAAAGNAAAVSGLLPEPPMTRMTDAVHEVRPCTSFCAFLVAALTIPTSGPVIASRAALQDA